MNAPTIEEVHEQMVALVADIASQNVKEEYRQRGQALIVADSMRRNERDGKHPVSGETEEQYQKTIEDRRNGGYHPITGESYEDYQKRKGTAPKPVAKGA